ncbi:MAG: CPBP family intramembrane metalloprotease [Phycisphaeraceae bacterium]|nr:CPBP family intramembrane metalloprotease [Phycisphaeraceae bacterium]
MPLDPSAPRPARPPREPPDPGTPMSRQITLTLAVALVLLVAGLQALSSIAAGQPAPVQAAEVDAPATTMDQFGLTARLYVLVLHGLGMPDPDGEASRALAKAAPTPRDEVRAVVSMAEMAHMPEAGAERALARIEELRPEFERLASEQPDEPEPIALLADLDALRSIYTDGPESLGYEARDRLVHRHGWFGRLALTFGLDDDAPERAGIFGPATALAFGVIIAAIVIPLAILVGFVLLVIGLVLFVGRSLRPRFVPPLPGGSVYLETLVVFLIGFLGVKMLADLVGHALSETAAVVTGLVLQAGLVVLILWPLARGVPFSRWRAATGWHAPRGVLREIGCGVLGYLAALPVFVGGVILSLILSAIWAMISSAIRGTPEHQPLPQNAPLDLVLSGNTVLVVLLFLMATIWAPIVEETIFRGALYRHARARVGAVVAGLLAALIFAFMHGYGPLFTPPLIALGFMFAMLREWRGSLTASVTAHFLHNFVTLSVLLVVVHLLGS